MSGTTTGIIVFVVAIVVSLAAWLIGVALAARRPGQEHPKQDQIRGLVQGGQRCSQVVVLFLELEKSRGKQFQPTRLHQRLAGQPHEAVEILSRDPNDGLSSGLGYFLNLGAGW